MSQNVRRAEILLNQGRIDDAEQYIKLALNDDLENDYTYFLNARLLAARKQLNRAIEMLNEAIKIDPNDEFYWYVKASYLFRLNKTYEAELLVGQAISRNPSVGAYYNLLALIKHSQKQHKDSLQIVTEGLQLSPDDVDLLNTKSIILKALGRDEEAADAIQGAIFQDPENDYTHTNLGWAALKDRDVKSAATHFKEALRLNSSSDYAREGLLEAMKGKYWFYRQFLSFQLWLETKTSTLQWIIIIGFIVVRNAVRKIGEHYPGLEFLTVPIFYTFLLVALGSWVLNPLANIAIRFTKEGKYLFHEKQLFTVDLLLVSAGIFVIGLLGSFFVSGFGFMALAIFGLSMLVPLDYTFNDNSSERKFNFYALGMAILGIIGVVKTFLVDDPLNFFAIAYFVAFIAFTWISSFWNSKAV